MRRGGGRAGRRRVAMVAEMTQTQITFPVEVERARGGQEAVWLSLVSKLLETRLLQLLRFKCAPRNPRALQFVRPAVHAPCSLRALHCAGHFRAAACSVHIAACAFRAAACSVHTTACAFQAAACSGDPAIPAHAPCKATPC